MSQVTDFVDAIDLIVVTRKRLIDHFVKEEKQELRLRELMEMCLDAPVEGSDFVSPPLLRVYGVGRRGFWSVVNGLTGMDLGSHCNDEWQKRLMRIKGGVLVNGVAALFCSSGGLVLPQHIGHVALRPFSGSLPTASTRCSAAHFRDGQHRFRDAHLPGELGIGHFPLCWRRNLAIAGRASPAFMGNAASFTVPFVERFVLYHGCWS